MIDKVTSTLELEGYSVSSTLLDDVAVDLATSSDFDAVLIMKGDRLAGIFSLEDAAKGFSAWLKKTYLPTDDPGCA